MGTGVLADRWDLPSKLLVRGTRWVQSASLTLFPVVVDDGVFKSALARERLPPRVAAALDGSSQTFWAEYLSARASGAIPSALRLRSDRGQLVRQLKERYPEAWTQIRKEADEVVLDRFAPFGTRPVALGRDFAWDDFPPAGNDVLYIWEISTLQHFPWLAQAYLATGDARYRTALERHLQGWEQRNPIANSVNWRSVMEVSLRMVSLVWTAELLADTVDAGQLLARLTRAIYAHARFVRETMDRHRSKNNHAIFEAAGLYLAASAYPELKSAEDWRGTAERRLWQELELQYLPSGLQREVAPAYHLPLLDAFLQYAAAKRARGETAPPRVLEALRRQAAVVRALCGPDGGIPLFSDSSDHHFLRLVADDYRDPGPTLHLSRLTIDGKTDSPPTEAAAWEVALLPGLKDMPSKPEPAQRENTTATATHCDGVLRLTSGPWFMTGMFASFTGREHFDGHRHCDLSSFVLWGNGVPWIVDPGTYTYRRSVRQQGLVMRDYLRESWAHNTTTVDGLSQAGPVEDDDFGYQRAPQAQVIFTSSNGELVAGGGQHDAYIASVGRSIRLFALVPRAVLVLDWYPEARGQHGYDSRLLFAVDGPTPERVDRSLWRYRQGAVQWSGRATDVVLLRGGVEPPGGWQSPAYGTLREANQMRTRQTAEGAVVIPVLLRLDQPKRNDPGALETEQIQGATNVRAQLDDGRLSVLLRSAAADQSIRASGIVTDARVVVRWQAASGETRNIVVGGTRAGTSGLDGPSEFVEFSEIRQTPGARDGGPR